MIIKNTYQRHQVYEALKALGFICSDCGATKNLHIVHKYGYSEHRKLAKLLGGNYVLGIVRDLTVRACYKLLCWDCRAKHDESLLDCTQEQASPKKQS